MKSDTDIALHLYPLVSTRERLSVWEKARGMWKYRKPDPIKELVAMRKEWERVATLSK